MKILQFVFFSLLPIIVWHDTSFVRVHTLNKIHHNNRLVTEDAPYQVIISEIMADPYPAVLLPNSEYIELCNRKEKAVDISGWKIIIGDRAKTILNATIEARSCLIICDNEHTDYFHFLENVIAVEGMPSILNGGQTITLKNAKGTIIHSVTFTDKWYASAFKSEGGWSLEIIDPDNPCGGDENWSESYDYRGGSPGIMNSVYATNHDALRPSLLRATASSQTSAKLHFSESMDSASMNNRYYYSVNQEVFHPQTVTHVAPDYKSVILGFGNDFATDINYKIFVIDSLRDCAGNRLEENSTVDFALPQKADSFDIVFNEILFDASDGINEYIELYNRSLKVLDLASFSLALLDPFTHRINKYISFNDQPFLLFPDSYLVITSDKTKLPEQTRNSFQHCIAEVPDFFSLPDNEGTVELYDIQFYSIDKITYSRQMHLGLLTTHEGAALERISADGPSNDPSNWHTAAESSGFATPGYQNSQMFAYEATAEDIRIIPELISPDNDGFADYTTINLNCGKPGNIANISIFDTWGHKIKTLAANELIGTHNNFTWDGTDMQNKIASPGIYLIYIELFHAKGSPKTFKKPITLVKRFQ